MNLRNIERWFKLYSNIVFIIALVIIGIYLWIIFYTGQEKFVNPDEIKAKSAAIPIPPDKVCEQPADPGFVCQNFSACCPPNSPNCICQAPNTQKCQQKYQDCLAGKLFSKESIEFLGADNLAQICQKFVNGCCSGNSNNKASQPATPKSGMKPNLSNPANSICQINGYKKPDLAEFCSQLCDDLPGCNYYQTDDMLGGCALFKGQPTPAEKGATASPVGNYKLFMHRTNSGSDSSNSNGKKSNSKEGFAADGQAAQFCLSGAVNKCKSDNNPSQDCLCSHSVIIDCQRINAECIKSGISKQVCKSQFGTCCGLLDSNDPTKQASISDKPKPGGGQPQNLLCRIPTSKTLDECRRACLNHDKCRFVDTNLLTGKNITNGYCDLYKGSADGTGKVLLSKPPSGNTIYLKQLGNPDELEANSALEKK